jgi:hypothetical protein
MIIILQSDPRTTNVYQLTRCWGCVLCVVSGIHVCNFYYRTQSFVMILVAVLVINYTMIGFGINVSCVRAEDSEDN